MVSPGNIFSCYMSCAKFRLKNTHGSEEYLSYEALTLRVWGFCRTVLCVRVCVCARARTYMCMYVCVCLREYARVHVRACVPAPTL